MNGNKRSLFNAHRPLNPLPYKIERDISYRQSLFRDNKINKHLKTPQTPPKSLLNKKSFGRFCLVEIEVHFSAWLDHRYCKRLENSWSAYYPVGLLQTDILHTARSFYNYCDGPIGNQTCCANSHSSMVVSS